MQDRGVVTPGMLKNKQFWTDAFPQYERENHSVNGLKFPRQFFEKLT
jgi:hypothetical protein